MAIVFKISAFATTTITILIAWTVSTPIQPLFLLLLLLLLLLLFPIGCIGLCSLSLFVLFLLPNVAFCGGTSSWTNHTAVIRDYSSGNQYRSDSHCLVIINTINSSASVLPSISHVSFQYMLIFCSPSLYLYPVFNSTER